METLLAFPLLLGSGYGLEPDWKHGMYQGDLVVQGQDGPPGRPDLLQLGPHRVCGQASPATGRWATGCSSAR